MTRLRDDRACDVMMMVTSPWGTAPKRAVGGGGATSLTLVCGVVAVRWIGLRNIGNRFVSSPVTTNISCYCYMYFIYFLAFIFVHELMLILCLCTQYTCKSTTCRYTYYFYWRVCKDVLLDYCCCVSTIGLP